MKNVVAGNLASRPSHKSYAFLYCSGSPLYSIQPKSPRNRDNLSIPMADALFSSASFIYLFFTISDLQM